MEEQIKKIYPHCGNRTFFVDVNVVQKWEVGRHGQLVRVKEGYTKVLKGPDPRSPWICSRCGAAAADEKDFPFDPDNFVIFCKSLQDLKTTEGGAGKSCYLSLKKEDGSVCYTVYNEKKQELFGSVLCEIAETVTVLDRVEEVLEMIFGRQGVKIAIFHMDKSYGFQLVDFEGGTT